MSGSLGCLHIQMAPQESGDADEEIELLRIVRLGNAA
jgi:hypothetical protein